MADCDNNRIRIVAMDGATTTLAGNGEGGHEDGPSQQRASFFCPNAVLAAPDGFIYVAEFHSIRKISTDGIVTTIAGSGGEQGFVHGPALFYCTRSVQISSRGIDKSGGVLMPGGRRIFRQPGPVCR